MGNKRKSLYAGEVEQRIRCLFVVRYLCNNGSGTVHEMSSALAGLKTLSSMDVDTIDNDIALLKQNGLSFRTDEVGRWRIEKMMPGFELRLTRTEVSLVWAWAIAHRDAAHALKPRFASIGNSEALTTLLKGLEQCHQISSIIYGDSIGSDPPQDQPPNFTAPGRDFPRLTGEARLIHRRLRIIDLIDSRNARNSYELAKRMGNSQRTINDDINVLRKSGVGIKYCHICRELKVSGLSEYLSDCITLPQAAALLVLFTQPTYNDSELYRSKACRIALMKLVSSISLLYVDKMKEQDELITTDHRSIETSNPRYIRGNLDRAAKRNPYTTAR